MPVRVGELSESGRHTRGIVEQYLKALQAGAMETAATMRSKDTLLMADYEKQHYAGQDVHSGKKKETVCGLANQSILWMRQRDRLLFLFIKMSRA
mgnify:CR=1 FL=1